MVAPLDIADVEIRGGPLVFASNTEIDDLESRLRVEFPDGYREYVTRLGEGILNVFVRVLPPWRVLAELDEHRGFMSSYWPWELGKVPFGQEQAMESIQLADTMDGDVIVFHPADRKQIIVLPRHHDRLFARGPDLLETINWVCSGGTIRRFGLDRYFEPFDSRLERDETVDATPTREPTSVASEPPLLDRSPQEVLMAYFAELNAVEKWALSMLGGPEAFLREEAPDLGPGPVTDELFARTYEVHARYCTPGLAKALSGSVAVSGTLEHDASAVRVLDEKEERPGRVVIRTAEGVQNVVALRKYVLEHSDGEWRVIAQADLGFETG